MLRNLIAAVVVAGLFVVLVPASGEDATASPLQLFEERILPIFRSPNPSSCVQCHLSSIDLKDYIRPSQEETFVALRDEGLIDLENPGESKILDLIRMGEKDLDKGAKLIHRRTRDAEYAAFTAWIRAASADERLQQLPADVAAATSRRDEAVIAFTRKSRLADSFARNIWSQRMRCFPCHTPGEIDAANPKHAKAVERHADFVEKYGQKMNIFRESPEATMRQLIVSSRRPRKGILPLINIDDPTQSLLVLKPTARVPKKTVAGQFEKPSSSLPVTHMGGLKMHVNDQSYKSFVTWIEDYARVIGDEYASAEDLPPDNWFPSKHVLRMKGLPDDIAVLTPFQLFVHSWDAGQSVFDDEPIAFTQAPLTPRRMVNGTIFLLGPKEASGVGPHSEAGKLAPGRYLVKVYADQHHRLVDSPSALLGDKDYLGSVELEAQWQEGFKNAEFVDGALLE